MTAFTPVSVQVSTPTPSAPKLCKVCGRPLPDRTGRAGRPSDFCPPPEGAETSACSRLDKRFQEVAILARKLVEQIEAEGDETDSTTTKQRLQKLKGYLWSEANMATNKGKLAGQPGAKRYGKTRSGWWRLAPERK